MMSQQIMSQKRRIKKSKKKIPIWNICLSLVLMASILPASKIDCKNKETHDFSTEEECLRMTECTEYGSYGFDSQEGK